MAVSYCAGGLFSSGRREEKILTELTGDTEARGNNRVLRALRELREIS